MNAPGFFWRRIIIDPTDDMVVGGLEDDVHRFTLRLRHRGSVIVAADAAAERFPYSTCPGAAPFIAEALIGLPLTEVATLDPPSHCTHLLDLAAICARYAEHRGPMRIDMRVDDRIDGRTSARLDENGVASLRWDLAGTVLEGPDIWIGRDLRALSRWKSELTPADAERAAMLRRAVLVSGSRALPGHDVARASERGPGRIGACFTHSPERQQHAVRSRDWRKDFSRSEIGPLQGFAPEGLRSIEVRP